MSYILDALRRADAERERDPARGIHAQPAAGLPAGVARSWPRGWSLAGVALVVLAAFAWWLPRQGAVAPAAVVQQPAVAPVRAAAPAAAVATAVSPPPPPAAPAPIPVAVEKAPVRAMTVAAVPARAAAPAAIAAVPHALPAALAAPATNVPAMPAPAATPAPAPAADHIVAVADLPPDVQRELPKLAISGGVHSENAAQRMLIVGGQLLTEGAEVAPGVTLEQIRARTAVLRYRGFRYSVPF